MVSINQVRRPSVPVGLRSLGHYLPSRQVDNDDLVQMGSPVSADWIYEKTGIRTRYFAEDHQAMSDLVIPAAQAALAAVGQSPQGIDAIIVSGDLHDSGGVQLTSAIVAEALGLAGVSCIDLRIGCPSSVLAIHVGSALVASALSNRVLIAAGEINTRGADFSDRTSVWFGDGAGAAILERCEGGTGILASFVAGTGVGSAILSVPAGGSREPITPEALAAGRNRLYMDGKAVFGFAVERMVESVESITQFLGITPKDLDWIVPHHANLRIIETAMRQLSLPMEKAYVNIERVGNTAGPSVLLALSEACHNGAIKSGQLVATVGFGGGLAWGAQVICVNSPTDFDVV